MTTPENSPEEEDIAEGGDALPQIESTEDLARIVQALVFASPEVVTLRRLREVLGDFLDARLVSEALMAANDQLNRIQSPFEIVEHAGGYRFRTRAKYYPWVRKLFPEMNQRRLSQAALETLAVVAYLQPISRGRVSAVRGVNVDGVMRTLATRDLIEEVGRDPETGARLYATTSYFLERMGLTSLEQLPALAPHLPDASALEAELAGLAGHGSEEPLPMGQPDIETESTNSAQAETE